MRSKCGHSREKFPGITWILHQLPTAGLARVPDATFSYHFLNIYDLHSFKENDFYIIVLDVCQTDFWIDKLDIEDDQDNDIILNCRLTHYFCKELGINHYAIIETDYFGGIGDQNANVYKNDKKQKSSVSINEALEDLGVISKKDLDEFDTLNLSKYRHFEDLYEKYWDNHNSPDYGG